jgi:hypothetical protein
VEGEAAEAAGVAAAAARESSSRCVSKEKKVRLHQRILNIISTDMWTKKSKKNSAF